MLSHFVYLPIEKESDDGWYEKGEDDRMDDVLEFVSDVADERTDAVLGWMPLDRRQENSNGEKPDGNDGRLHFGLGNDELVAEWSGYPDVPIYKEYERDA